MDYCIIALLAGAFAGLWIGGLCVSAACVVYLASSILD